jgi:hypothetical protein
LNANSVIVCYRITSNSASFLVPYHRDSRTVIIIYIIAGYSGCLGNTIASIPSDGVAGYRGSSVNTITLVSIDIIGVYITSSDNTMALISYDNVAAYRGSPIDTISTV